MSYMVDGGTRKRPRFPTLEQANAFANQVLRDTGFVLGVYEDPRPANSVFKKGD